MEFGKRIYPKWLLILFFSAFLVLTFYVPTQVLIRTDVKPMPGPHVLLFSFPERVFLYEGKYFTSEPIDIEWVIGERPHNSVQSRLVNGVDYGRMALQYLALLAAFLPLALIFSKKTHSPENQPGAEKAREDLYSPHSLLVVSYQLAANTDKKEGMNYKDKQARLTNAIKSQKDFLGISPCIWIVELFQKGSPASFEAQLSALVSPYDRIVVSGLIHTALQASDAEIEWINRRLDRI